MINDLLCKAVVKVGSKDFWKGWMEPMEFEGKWYQKSKNQ